jgi:TPR repeat protein
MRISERFFSVLLFGVAFGLATAYAVEIGRSVPDAAVTRDIGVERRSTPAFVLQPGAGIPRTEPQTGLTTLEAAAANGQATAAWKLGRMYADGDGVQQSDIRAFEYFRSLADANAEELPGTPQARYVANAFVALGNYYLEGVPNSDIKADAVRAREMFAYAASYFGDPEAQYQLGRMYLEGKGGRREPKQAARWLSLAAKKGEHRAQAILGSMLFSGQYVPRQAPLGLMWLTVAHDAASSQEIWIADLHAAALKQATDDERAVALVYLERWLEGRPN